MIDTERLLLRLPRLDDAGALLEFVGDEEIMHLLGDQPGGIEKADALVERWMARWERNGVGRFIVERGNELIGRYILGRWTLISRPLAGARLPTLLAAVKKGRIAAFVIESPWLLSC